MNISEAELEALIAKYPSEEASIDRLRSFIASERSADDVADHVFTLERLVRIIRPESSWNFAYILSELARSGVLNQFVRLYSSSGTGLEDFDSIENVPAKVHDMTIDQEVDVGPDDVKILFKLGANG